MADATVSSVAAIAAGKAPPANSILSAVANVPAAGAAGDAIAPSATGGAGGGATITAVVADATGKATAPAVAGGSSSATVAAVVARANGKAVTPSIPGLPVLYDVRSVSTVSGTGTSFTLNTPAGATASDAIYVCLVHSQNVQVEAANPLQGWTLATASAFQTFITVRVLQTAALATSGPWTFNFFRGGLPYADTYVAAAVCVQADSSVIGAQRAVVDSSAAKTVAPTTGPFVFPVVTPGATGDVVLYVGGWGRHTTMTPPGGVIEKVDLSSGTGSSDKHLWVGSRNNATVAGVTTTAVSVDNDNPSGFTGDGQGMITVALMSVAPPTAWTGDFETGDFSQYAFVLEAASDRITIQTDTPHQGTKYARFTAHDADVYPLTPTNNPRASLVSPRILYPGFERWIQWSVRFPVDFPLIPSTGWLVFFQYHGPPYNGSPSIGFGVDEDRINLERNQTYDYDTIWTVPLVKGQWIDFVLRVNFAQDETGFIELWVNQVQQVFAGGVRRLYMRTVELDQISGLEIDPLIYRMSGMFEAATIDFDGIRFDASVPSSLSAAIQIAPPVFMFGNGPPDPTAVARVVP